MPRKKSTTKQAPKPISRQLWRTELGKLVKTKLVEKSLSIRNLAEICEMDESAIKNIIYGSSKKPRIDTIIKIASILGISMSELLRSLDLDQSYSAINKDKFISTIILVDEMCKKHKLSLSSELKAKLYLSWYDLILTEEKILTSTEMQDEKFKMFIEFIDFGKKL